VWFYENESVRMRACTCVSVCLCVRGGMGACVWACVQECVKEIKCAMA
jgi:hypothetical protein